MKTLIIILLVFLIAAVNCDACTYGNAYSSSFYLGRNDPGKCDTYVDAYDVDMCGTTFIAGRTWSKSYYYGETLNECFGTTEYKAYITKHTANPDAYAWKYFFEGTGQQQVKQIIWVGLAQAQAKTSQKYEFGHKVIVLELVNTNNILLVFKDQTIVQAVIHQFNNHITHNYMKLPQQWAFYEYSSGVYDIVKCNFNTGTKAFKVSWLRHDNTEVQRSSYNSDQDYRWGSSAAMRRGDYWYIGGSKSPSDTQAEPLIVQVRASDFKIMRGHIYPENSDFFQIELIYALVDSSTENWNNKFVVVIPCRDKANFDLKSSKQIMLIMWEGEDFSSSDIFRVQKIDVVQTATFIKIDYLISKELQLVGRTFSTLDRANKDQNLDKMIKVDIRRPFCIKRDTALSSNQQSFDSTSTGCTTTNGGVKWSAFDSALKQTDDFVPALARPKNHLTEGFIRIATSTTYFTTTLNSGKYAVVAVYAPSFDSTSNIDSSSSTEGKTLVQTTWSNSDNYVGTLKTDQTITNILQASLKTLSTCFTETLGARQDAVTKKWEYTLSTLQDAWISQIPTELNFQKYDSSNNPTGLYKDKDFTTYPNLLTLTWENSYSQYSVELFKLTAGLQFEFYITARNMLGKTISPKCSINVFTCGITEKESYEWTFNFIKGVDNILQDIQYIHMQDEFTLANPTGCGFSKYEDTATSQYSWITKSGSTILIDQVSYAKTLTANKTIKFDIKMYDLALNSATKVVRLNFIVNESSETSGTSGSTSDSGYVYPKFKSALTDIQIKVDPKNVNSEIYRYTSPFIDKGSASSNTLEVKFSPMINCNSRGCLIINTYANYFELIANKSKISDNDRGQFKVQAYIYDTTKKFTTQQSMNVLVFLVQRAPPYFDDPLIDIFLEHDYKNYSEVKDIVKYKLPYITVNQDPLATLKSVYFKTYFDDSFITFLNETNDSESNYTFQFDPNKVTKRTIRRSPISINVVMVDSFQSEAQKTFKVHIIQKSLSQNQNDNDQNSSNKTTFLTNKQTDQSLNNQIKSLRERFYNSPQLVQTRVSQISSLGKVQVNFDQPIDIIDPKSLIKKSQQKVAPKTGRYLQELDFINSEVIQINLNKSDQNLVDDENQKKVKAIDYSIEKLDKSRKSLTFQLNLSKPFYISDGIQQDKIIVQFVNPNIFKSQNGQQRIGQVVIESYIKKQLPQQPSSMSILKANQSIFRIMSSLTIALFVTTLLTMRLKTRWLSHSIMPLQIIILHSLINWPLPVNLVEFLIKIKSIAFFDLLPEQRIQLQQKIGIEENKEDLLKLTLCPQQRDLGFTSHSAVANSLPLMFLVGLIGLGLFTLTFQSCLSSIFKSKFEFIRMKCVLHSLSHLALAGFMPLSITLYFYFKSINTNINYILTHNQGMFFQFFNTKMTFESSLNHLFAYTAALLIVAYLPICLLLLLLVKNKYIKNGPAFFKVFGFFYYNLRTDKRSQLAYRIIFVLRRVVLLFIGFEMSDYPLFQMYLTILISYIQIFYLAIVEPLESKSQNRIEQVNEFLISLMQHILFFFGEPGNLSKDQFYLGWAVIGLCVLIIFINYQYVIREIFWRLKMLYIKSYIKIYFELTGIKLGMNLKPIEDSESDSNDDDERNRSESYPLRFGLNDNGDDKDDLHKFGRFQMPPRIIFDLNLSMTKITEQTEQDSIRELMPETGDDELDELLRKAQELLDDQNLFNKRKNEIDQQKQELLDRIARRKRRKKGDGDDDEDGLLDDDDYDEELENLLRQAQGLLDDQAMFNLRKAEIARQQEELMKRLRKRQRKKKDGEPDDPNDMDEIQKLLAQAKDLLLNQQLYDQRNKESEKQLQDLLEKIARRKRKRKGKGDDDSEDSDMHKLLLQASQHLIPKDGSNDKDKDSGIDKELEELLRQAKELLGGDNENNQRLAEISRQEQSLLDKIKRRNRKRRGLPEDSADEELNKDGKNGNEDDIDKFMREARAIIDDHSMLLQRQKENIEQEKQLNEKLRNRNKKRNEKKKNDINLLEAALNQKNNDIDEELNRLLKQAKGILDNQEQNIKRQSEIGKQQDDLLERLRQRKLRRQKEIENGDKDQKKERDYQKDIDALMREAERLMLDQTAANKKQQETDKQQRELMEKLRQRNARRVRRVDENGNEIIDENDDDFDQLLAEAENLLQEKQKNDLLLDENSMKQNNDIKNINDRRQRYRDKLGQPQDMDQYLQEAKRVIDDQQMLAKQKMEIGQQQDQLMDKIAKRRGKKAAKKPPPTQEEQEQRKLELLNPHLEKKKEQVDNQDLDDLIERAKEIINDQNLIANMQIDLSNQQIDQNQKLLRAQQKNKAQEELDKILAKIHELAEDQNILNNKLQEIEKEQEKVLQNIQQENKAQAEAAGEDPNEIDNLIQQAKNMVEEQTELTDKKMSSDNKLFLRVLDQKQKQKANANPEEISKQLKKFLKFQLSKENINVLLQKAKGIIANQSMKSQRDKEIEQQDIKLKERLQKRKEKMMKKVVQVQPIVPPPPPPQDPQPSPPNLSNLNFKNLLYNNDNENLTSERKRIYQKGDLEHGLGDLQDVLSDEEAEQIQINDKIKSSEDASLEFIGNGKNISADQSTLTNVKPQDEKVESILEDLEDSEQSFGKNKQTSNNFFKAKRGSGDPGNGFTIDFDNQKKNPAFSTMMGFNKAKDAIEIDNEQKEQQSKIKNMFNVHLNQMMMDKEREEFEKQQQRKLNLQLKAQMMKNKKANVKFI